MFPCSQVDELNALINGLTRCTIVPTSMPHEHNNREMFKPDGAHLSPVCAPTPERISQAVNRKP